MRASKGFEEAEEDVEGESREPSKREEAPIRSETFEEAWTWPAEMSLEGGGEG